MPINNKLLGPIQPARRDSSRRGLASKPASKEASLQKAAREGGKAFESGALFGENPYRPLDERALHNAWAVGWKGSQTLQELQTGNTGNK